MAETAANIITSGRYDLRDANSLQFADAELLDYLNRAVRLLDSRLLQTNSDWCHATDDSITLEEDDNSVTAPTDMVSVRSIWIDDNQLIKRSLDEIIYSQNFTTEGEPDSYALDGADILFDRDADDDYDLVINYNAKQDALETTDTMPYSDEFNEQLKQVMVLFAQKRQGYDVNPTALAADIFDEATMNRVVHRNYTPTRKRLDF